MVFNIKKTNGFSGGPQFGGDPGIIRLAACLQAADIDNRYCIRIDMLSLRVSHDKLISFNRLVPEYPIFHSGF